MTREEGWRELGLADKIGQLFVCGFDGTAPSDRILELIRGYGIGGVIYFRRNLRDAGQAAALSSELQRASRVPLFLAIDQEGGMVVRLEEGVTVMPGAMAVGAAGDEELAYEAAKLSALELREIGINLNFAPSLDVNNNPRNPVIGVRSYGEEPGDVARLGAAAVRGYRDGGVAAVVKHFPGHGDTAADSHRELPFVPHDRDRLDRVELLPFRHAIEQGAEAVMTAHVAFPAFEPELRPATLSHPVLTGLLRERLGFRGVIVTDCLEMKAISETVGVARGAVEAVKAGADLVLVSHTPGLQKAAIEAVREAVRTGEIPESRIDESVGRIWRLKERGGLFYGRADRSDSAAAREVAGRICDRAVTLVKGGERLPLPRTSTIAVIWAEPRSGTEMIEVIPQHWTLGAALAAEGYGVDEVRIGLEPTDAECEAALAAAQASGATVFASYDAGFSPSQAGLIWRLSAACGGLFVLAATRTPYDLLACPDAPVYLCTYENKPRMMTALAGVLSGRLRPAAKLPVTVGPHARGSGG